MNNRWRRIVKHTGWEKVATACVHHRKVMIGGRECISACLVLEGPSLLTGKIMTYRKSGTINAPTPSFRKGAKHYAVKH